MGYILPLLFIALISISTSIITNNTQEINEVGKFRFYQQKCFDFFGKALSAIAPYKVQINKLDKEKGLFESINNAERLITNITDGDRQIIMKGKKLIKQFENFKSIFEKGLDIYKKNIVYQNSNKYERVTSVNNIRNDALIYKVCREEYNKMREAYNQIKKYCNHLKS